MSRLTQCLSVLNVTHVCMTPTLWAMRGKLDERDTGDAVVPSILPCLQELALGGEKMPTDLVECARAHWTNKVRLVNTYGVTECTIYQSHAVLNESHGLEPKKLQSLIGRPYDALRLGLKTGERICWLGEDDETLNEDAEGEIVIKGEQVGNGYVSAKSSRYSSIGSRRVFATGDLAAVCTSKVYGKCFALIGKVIPCFQGYLLGA